MLLWKNGCISNLLLNMTMMVSCIHLCVILLQGAVQASFLSFFKLRFSTFLSKLAKQVGFLLACDLILTLEKALFCLLKHKPRENLTFLFIIGLDFRLLTVQTSLQNRINKERRRNTVSGWAVWCLDTASFHSRVTFQAGRCFPFSKNACEMHDSSRYCKQPKMFCRAQGRTHHS